MKKYIIIFLIQFFILSNSAYPLSPQSGFKECTVSYFVADNGGEFLKTARKLFEQSKFQEAKDFLLSRLIFLYKQGLVLTEAWQLLGHACLILEDYKNAYASYAMCIFLMDGGMEKQTIVGVLESIYEKYAKDAFELKADSGLDAVSIALDYLSNYSTKLALLGDYKNEYLAYKYSLNLKPGTYNDLIKRLELRSCMIKLLHKEKEIFIKSDINVESMIVFQIEQIFAECKLLELKGFLNADVLKERAFAYFEQGEYAESIKDMKQSLMLRLGVDSVDKVCEQYKQGIKENEEYIEKGLNILVEIYEEWIKKKGKAAALEEIKVKIEEAIGIYKEVLFLNPNKFDNWVNLGELYQKNKNLRSAYTCFIVAEYLERDERKKSDLHKKCGIIAGLLSKEEIKYDLKPDKNEEIIDLVITYFAETLSFLQGMGSSVTYDIYGLFLTIIPRTYAQLDVITKFRRAFVEFITAVYTPANANDIIQKQFDLILKQTEGVSGNADILQLRAYALCGIGKFDEAIVCYKNAIEKKYGKDWNKQIDLLIESDRKLFIDFLAALLFSPKNNERIIEDIYKGLLDPKDIETYTRLMNFYKTQAMKQEAVDLYAQMLKIDANNLEYTTEKAKLLFGLARLDELEKDLDYYIPIFEKKEKAGPEFALLYYYKALLMKKRGENNFSLLKTAFEKSNKKYIDITKAYAFICFKNGDKEFASMLCSGILGQITPEDPDFKMVKEISGYKPKKKKKKKKKAASDSAVVDAVTLAAELEAVDLDVESAGEGEQYNDDGKGGWVTVRGGRQGKKIMRSEQEELETKKRVEAEFSEEAYNEMVDEIIREMKDLIERALIARMPAVIAREDVQGRDFIREAEDQESEKKSESDSEDDSDNEVVVVLKPLEFNDYALFSGDFLPNFSKPIEGIVSDNLLSCKYIKSDFLKYNDPDRDNSNLIVVRRFANGDSRLSRNVCLQSRLGKFYILVDDAFYHFASEEKKYLYDFVVGVEEERIKIIEEKRKTNFDYRFACSLNEQFIRETEALSMIRSFARLALDYKGEDWCSKLINDIEKYYAWLCSFPGITIDGDKEKRSDLQVKAFLNKRKQAMIKLLKIIGSHPEFIRMLSDPKNLDLPCAKQREMLGNLNKRVEAMLINEVYS